MNKNMNSPTKLTEFAPLSPEESPPAVASFFSKIFSFTRGSGSSNAPAISPTNEDKNSFLDSPEKTSEEDNTSVLSFPIDSSEGRSLPNVLKRISNIVAVKSNNLQSYKDTQLRSYWMPDNVSKQCYECGERFTTFRRRHHCRVCGQIFCSKCCCDEIPGKIMGCTGDLRVCTYCCKVVLSYLQSLDMRSDLTADLKALQEDLQVKYGNDLPPVSEKCSDDSTKNETLVCRKSSVGYMEEKYVIGRSTNSYLSMQERAIALQNSASLRMIYEKLFHSNNAIMLQTHRIRLKSYQNCFLGSELVNWIIARNIAATRIQAIAIGQALLEAGFIESVFADTPFSDSAAIFKPVNVNFQSADFLSGNQTNCDTHEPAWVKTIPQHDSTTDSESEAKQPPSTGRLPSSSSSFYLDLNLESSTVTLKRPQSEDLVSMSMDSNDGLTDDSKEDSIKMYQKESDQKVSDELLKDSLQVEDLKGLNGWHKVKNLRNTYGEASAYNQLMSAYKQHEDILVKQLLIKEGVSLNWSETIIQIASQIIDHIRPNLYHDADDMDVRHYVQIKKSPGGNRNDCEIVSGVVCSKNVAHRGMNAMIANPKILLLRCGLMYQRTEGKLLSLEPVMMQENEYLGHTVARITALGPDVVLVHRSVSRLAQDRLRDNGITLVLNVKLSILERVARCTGANIVDTVDAHISARFKLGTCKKFYLRQFPGEKNTLKTLMYFEGCANPHLGSTIILRGGPQTELRKVKNVVFNMIFAAYSWRLEKSFLMDEFAKPPTPKDGSFLDDTFRENSPKKKEVMPRKSSKDDNVSETEVFKPISEALSDATNVYDTLKLFRRKSQDEKPTNSENQNKISENLKGTSRDRIVSSEEKRVHGESISDCSDPLQSYLNDDEEAESFNNLSPNGELLSVVQDLPLLNKFKKALEDTILSVSPYLKFSIPYLETKAGRNCILREFFPKDVYYSAYFLDKTKDSRDNKVVTESTQVAHGSLDNMQVKSQHPFVEMKITSKMMDSKEILASLAHFRACGSRLEKTNNILLPKKQLFLQNDIPDGESIWPDCLDMEIHQRLPVLFCSFLHSSNDAPAFCVNPWIVNMDLYGRNDIALGRFLEKYCLTSSYKCPAQNCRAQIAQHERRFVHDGGCIHINLTNLTTETFSNENSDQIMMWSKCLQCKSVSPVTPISDDTWALSFAKYLELRFHGGVYTRRDTDTCEHSLHHEHIQYFSKKNMLAMFRYKPISQWEISLPPPFIRIHYNPKRHALVIEELKSLTLKGEEVFSLVRDKLATLQLDFEILNSLKQSLNKDHQYFKSKIEQIQLKLTSPSIETAKSKEKQTQVTMHRVEDGIVILKRLISEAVVNWNMKIIEISNKKRDEKMKKPPIEKPANENDGTVAEEIVSDSQLEDLSPMSADYNAIEAIHSVMVNEMQQGEMIEGSDNETVNPEDIVVVHGSPKIQQKIDVSVSADDSAEKKKKMKTILSQLLPSTATSNPIPNMLGLTEHHLLPLGSVVPIVVYESEPSSIIAYAHGNSSAVKRWTLN